MLFDVLMILTDWMIVVTCRVMDAFLIDGVEIIFRLAVAILTFGKEDLLSLDMEGMLKVNSLDFFHPKTDKN